MIIQAKLWSWFTKTLIDVDRDTLIGFIKLAYGVINFFISLLMVWLMIDSPAYGLSSFLLICLSFD